MTKTILPDGIYYTSKCEKMNELIEIGFKFENHIFPDGRKAYRVDGMPTMNIKNHDDLMECFKLRGLYYELT